jgi:transposase-like protein
MKSARSRYHGQRYPPEIIGHAVWLYYKFGIRLRDVEDLLAERGITVSYETIRRWCTKFGLDYAKRLKRRQGRLGDTWFLDEVFVTINGERQYLWRAVDQDGDVIDLVFASGTPHPSGGGALLSQAAEGARESSVSAGHGQVEKLRLGAADDLAFSEP